MNAPNPLYTVDDFECKNIDISYETAKAKHIKAWQKIWDMSYIKIALADTEDALREYAEPEGLAEDSIKILLAEN